MTEDLIDVIKSKKLMPFSSSYQYRVDQIRILKLMNRKHTIEEYLKFMKN